MHDGVNEKQTQHDQSVNVSLSQKQTTPVILKAGTDPGFLGGSGGKGVGWLIELLSNLSVKH